MKKLLLIARWEYIEKVRTRAFVISIFLTPAIIIFFTLVPALFSGTEVEITKAYGIIDNSGKYFEPLKERLESLKLPDGQPKYILIKMGAAGSDITGLKREADENIMDNSLQGCLIINNGGTDSVSAELRAGTAGSYTDISIFESNFNNARIELLLKSIDVNQSLINSVSKKISLKTITIDQGGKESKTDIMTLFFSSFILLMLLIMMILSTGGMLVRSLLEEKSNRLIEILVSSCTKQELLGGKILALSGLGLTQLTVWGVISLTLSGSAIVPPEAFDKIVPMLGFFILGYIFYTSIFVGVGSIVTTEQEAQQMTSYISLLLIFPTAFSLYALQNPGSQLIKILSYIPFTSTSVMLIRLKIEQIPLIEILMIVLIMLISIYVMIFFASRMFKVGILSYGKKPTVKEILSWIFEK